MVRITVITPKRDMERLERAAARGSDTNNNAVAIAELLLPKLTPRVMYCVLSVDVWRKIDQTVRTSSAF